MWGPCFFWRSRRFGRGFVVAVVLHNSTFVVLLWLNVGGAHETFTKERVPLRSVLAGQPSASHEHTILDCLVLGDSSSASSPVVRVLASSQSRGENFSRVGLYSL